MRDRVSDQVWRQLDPRAGRLSARTRRRLLLAATVATLLVIAIAAAWHAGLLVPRLGVSLNGTGVQSGRLELPMTIKNHNSQLSVRVLAAGRSGPGLELVEVAGSPGILAPGEAVELTLVYRVTDCAAVPDRPWPVPVQVARPWGVQTIHLHLPRETADDAPAHTWTGSGRGPYEVEWQRYYADNACR